MFSPSAFNGRLSGLCRGQTAQVAALGAQGPLRRRLQDLGLIEGTTVECLGKSPLGDPCAYLIRGAVIALRQADADAIRVQAPRTPGWEAQHAGRPSRGAGLPAGQVTNHGAF